MARRKRQVASGKAKLNLPPEVISSLKEMGFGRELRMLNMALQGDTTSQLEADRLCPPTRKLGSAFASISPDLDQKLYGDFVSRCWSCMLYAATLSKDLHKLARMDRKSSTEDLISELALIYEADLRGLRRQAIGLQRDIVRLIKELGGNPSEEL